MMLPHGATIVVADGAKLLMFRNTGTDSAPVLAVQPHPDLTNANKGSGGRHQSSAANPDDSQLDEDSFAAGAAAWLNSQALAGKIDSLVVVAAPRTLGELRKHYHKALTAKLHGELAKDLTGHSVADITKALAAA